MVAVWIDNFTYSQKCISDFRPMAGTSGGGGSDGGEVDITLNLNPCT